MKLRKNIFKVTSSLIVLAMILQTVSCGTLLYPERRQKSHQLDPAGRQIDPAVVVMDAVCLFFFIIPGVVAFAVDFSTGAIYLPKKDKKSAGILFTPNKVAVLHVIPGKMNQSLLERIVYRETGKKIRFDDKNLSAFNIESKTNIKNLLARLNG